MKDVASLLQQLADKLGIAIEKLWSALIRQAPISATVNLVICLILIAIATSLYFMGRRMERENEWDDIEKGMALVFFSILCLFTLAIICCLAEGIVAGYLNPEFWALDKILSSLKN